MVDPLEKLSTSRPKLFLTNSMNSFTVSGPFTRMQSQIDHLHDLEPSGRSESVCSGAAQRASSGRLRVLVFTRIGSPNAKIGIARLAKQLRNDSIGLG